MSDKRFRRPDEPDRDAVDEQITEWAAGAWFQNHLISSDAVAQALAECPEEFLPWLRAVHSRYIMDRCSDAAQLLDEVARLGFIRAVLANVDCDDTTAKNRRRGWNDNRLPNTHVVPAVLRHAIAHEEPEWRALATKWLPTYLRDDRDELVALLTCALQRPAAPDSFHAALHLAELAPDTPGLIERLIDATRVAWIATRNAHYETGETGADRAAALLVKLGCRADVVLPVCARLLVRDDSHAEPHAERTLTAFLNQLPAAANRWTDEDRWTFTLRGKSAWELDWAVFADFLDDRADPRGEYVRLRHAFARSEPISAELLALAAQQTAWLATHGTGWERVYDVVIQFSAPAEGV
jgi:hypothetical protein